MPDSLMPATQDLQQMRVDLAACLRLAAYFGFHEGIDNHFTVSVDETGERFLVHPYGKHWSEMTASDICLVDRDGKLLEGAGPIDDTAFYIHSRVHLGQPQARAVFHTHMPYATALTLLKDQTLHMCQQNALRFHGSIAYDGVYNGLVWDGDEGDRICRALDGLPILFMANHGVLVTGKSCAVALDRLYYLERAAKTQVLAMGTGQDLKIIPDDIAAATRAQFAKHEVEMADVHLAALKRLLDRSLPGYAA